MKLQIIWKYYYSVKSAGDKGSLFHLKNRLNRTNVPNEVKRDFNSAEDFIETITSSLIIAAALETLGMHSVEDTPGDCILKNAQDIWMKPLEVRKALLGKICEKIYEKFISLSYTTTSKDYVYTPDDSVSGYSIQLLRIGSLYLEFADAIREGDGQRVFRCWRYFVPIIQASHSTNYACESVHFLHQIRQCSWLSWKEYCSGPTHGAPQSPRKGSYEKLEFEQGKIVCHSYGGQITWNSSSTVTAI